MTSRKENIHTKYRQVLDSDTQATVDYEESSRSLSEGDKSKPRREEGYKDMPWNNYAYKPETKVCEEFWYDFMSAAKMLRIIDKNRTAKDKSRPEYWEPDVYSVFNKLRQDYHNELPYGENFIKGIDEEIEREIIRERRTGKRSE